MSKHKTAFQCRGHSQFAVGNLFFNFVSWLFLLQINTELAVKHVYLWAVCVIYGGLRSPGRKSENAIAQRRIPVDFLYYVQYLIILPWDGVNDIHVAQLHFKITTILSRKGWSSIVYYYFHCSYCLHRRHGKFLLGTFVPLKHYLSRMFYGCLPDYH